MLSPNFFEDKSNGDNNLALFPLVQILVFAPVWTQNYPQISGTCPGLPLQLLSRISFFQSDRPEPPPP